MTDTNELRKLLNAATPTPWAVSYGDKSWEVVQTKPDGTPDLFARRTAFDDGSACGEYCPSCNGPTRDLIVAAVNALPALLDELDAAREHMGVVQSALDAAHLEQVEDELGGLRAEIRRLDSVIDDIEERAWEALGKPEGTYETTNVQRLCAEVERLRARVAVLEWGLAQLVLEGEDAAFDPLQDRLQRCGIMPTQAALDAAKETN